MPSTDYQSPTLGHYPFAVSQEPRDSRGIRSIPAFCEIEGTDEADDELEGGADIPDIPLLRRGMSPPADALPKLPPKAAQRPGYAQRPGFIQWSDSKRQPAPDLALPLTPTSPTGLMEHNQRGRVVHTPDSDRHERAASISPSSATRSLLSKSSRSRLNSSDASSILLQNAPSNLPALQARAITDHDGGLQPLAEEEIDPASFDLVVPAHAQGKQYSLETQSEQLFSSRHLAEIFKDPLLLQRFTNYIYQTRPQSIPILQYYMDALKALKAIEYANAVVNSLGPVEGQEFTSSSIDKTINQALREKADAAFESLTNHELPAYITHTYIQTVSLTIKRRIADTLPRQLVEMSEGLAEVFCLTDPSRPDNPIVFASEEFHKTTQYGMSYVLGRNCRFLQGPKTNPFSVKRIREKLEAGQEHCETFLNYRRDGSPFMNLLMVAPLYDSRGTVRYHIGAQVDISGLVKDCAGLDSLERLMRHESNGAPRADEPVKIYVNGDESSGDEQEQEKPDEFRDLASMFSLQELKTVREAGGSLHRIHQAGPSDTEGVANWHKPRLHIRDDATTSRRDSDPVLQTMGPNVLSSLQGQTPDQEAATSAGFHHKTPGPRRMPTGGRLQGVYEHYLLVRPYPSLRILFASPSLRVPGMLQSSLMARVGGISPKVRDALTQAFADGHGVTAKVRWMTGHVVPSGATTSRHQQQQQQQQEHQKQHQRTRSRSRSPGAIPGSGATRHNGLNGHNVASADYLNTDPFDGPAGGGGGMPAVGEVGAAPPPPQSRTRWIHCTPLLGSNGAVGVWMVVLVDDEEDASARLLAREAPPVAPPRSSARHRERRATATPALGTTHPRSSSVAGTRNDGRTSGDSHTSGESGHHGRHRDRGRERSHAGGHGRAHSHRNGASSRSRGVMSEGEDHGVYRSTNKRVSVSTETGSLHSFSGSSDIFTLGDGASMQRGRSQRRNTHQQAMGGFLEMDYSDRETIDTMRLDY